MRIVLCPGVFDCFHEGHSRLLNAAKHAGDSTGEAWLIVAVNDDASVRLLKGPGRPIQSLRTRMAVVSKHPSVDAVICFTGAQYELLEAIHPDVVVKGSDYTEDKVIGHQLIKSYGGRIKIVERIKGFSTTELVAKSANSR